MIIKYCCVVLGCLFTLNGLAQFTLSGRVQNAQTAQPLVGATVQIDATKYAVVTNSQGQFEIQNIPASNYTIRIRFLGFSEKTIPLALHQNEHLDINLDEASRWTDEVIVRATRASDQDPVAFSELNESAIRALNTGRDMPFILDQTPSAISLSDAGAGVGYTGIRIRGSDATRINITINGIPFNDSESHGVFWVNMPDIASSTKSIQVQRGVGTSTNGAGAFGASINLSTDLAQSSPHANLVNTYGSFNTHLHTLSVGTGLLWKRFMFEGRLSLIQSDGFVDRASSNLRSFYVSGKYEGENTTLSAIAFGGHEITYQSWYGVPESRLNNDEQAMRTTAAVEGWNELQLNNLLTSNNRTFNVYTYENQVDNYEQEHYQMHAAHRFSPSLTANASLHYTYGRGYFEQFQYDQSFNLYGLPNPTIGDSTISTTDLIRRKALDNHFYGVTYSVSYQRQKYTGALGGAWNHYEGTHLGRIIWAELSTVMPKDFQYYLSRGNKYDFNIFWKSEYRVRHNVYAFLDLQYRRIEYKASGNRGTGSGLRDVDIDVDYHFFNPKAGITYMLPKNSSLYASYGIANREPVRADFINAPEGTSPTPETLHDLEIGWRIKRKKYRLNINGYWMRYENQRVLTGELNDVGAAIRTSVPKSYRLGIEIDGMIQLHNKLTWQANVTFSRNKIERFTEIIYDYGDDFSKNDIIQHPIKDTDISFSPNIIAASTITYKPIKGLALSWLTKYVSDQFLDNTSSQDRKVDAYLLNDVTVSYTLKPRCMKEVALRLFLHNVFDEQYEAYGYTYGYRGGGETIRQNYYFPQAGIHYTVMLSLRL